MGNILWECMFGGRLILVRVFGDVLIFNNENVIKVEDLFWFEEEVLVVVVFLVGKNVC